MTYEEIMEEIKSGLTGNPDEDGKYLLEQSEKYQHHELSKEITRGIGRLLVEVFPQEVRAQFSQAFANESLGIESAVEEATFQMSRKDFDKASEILETAVKKVENDAGERVLFADDTVSEYHRFSNYFEEVLYKCVESPTRELHQISEPLDVLYTVYGTLLVEQKRFDEASDALNKAIQINPINLQARFERNEIDKLNGNLDAYMEATKGCMKIAYTSKDLGRCYRNLGYCYIANKEYKIAIALYTISMHFDSESLNPKAELFYIRQKTGKDVELPPMVEIKKLLKKNKIQIGASEEVLGTALALAQKAVEQGMNDMARSCFLTFYDLTGDEKIKELIDTLS